MSIAEKIEAQQAEAEEQIEEIVNRFARTTGLSPWRVELVETTDSDDYSCSIRIRSNKW